MAITGFSSARGGAVVAPPVQLDESQRAVLHLADAASAAILGAPGTGKTTTIIELIADRVLVRGYSADEVVVLTTNRSAATRLRDRIAVRLGVATNGPLARTVNSLAFEIAGAAASHAGAEPPRLITGGEQDFDIAQLLEGHLELGFGPDWPELLGPEVRRLRGFRTELRELMARATEFDISPQKLRALGFQHDRPEWVAAADFIAEYIATTSSYRENQFDSAEIARYAVAALDARTAGDRVDRLRLVVVDDLQEATESTLSILRGFARRGVSIVVAGDPDVATNAFRGGEPDALGRLGTVLGLPLVETLTLSTAHRQGEELRQFTSTITSRIGTAAAGRQRRAIAGRTEDSVVRDVSDASTPTPPAVSIIEAQSPARQWAAVARQLREQHLMHGVPWGRIAVVVRSSEQISGIRRSLALAEVPARQVVGGTALRDDRAARALLSLVDLGIKRSPLTAEAASDLLLGPFGGLDRLALRRLRLALRAEELADDGFRSSDELLVEALATPGRFAAIDHRVGRAAERLSLTLFEIEKRALAGGTIEELLWLGWERSGLAKTWFDQALSAGITAAEANTNLDGIVALFTAARRFAERKPGDPASVFLDNVLEAEVPEDTLSPQPADDAVLVTTPSGTVGLEFDVVVVAALQDGAWPNLRLRGSLLGPADLVRIVTGVDTANLDERRLVLEDELRMFALAVSRATTRVILSAVANEDEAPSVFLSLAPKGSPVLPTAGLAPMSLRGLTGRLRRELVLGGRTLADRSAAASALARLARERVPGADPDDWHGLLPISTDAAIFGEDERVPVSPSRLERFEESPVDWFIETVSGSQSSTAMGLGTILHWAMETAATPDLDDLWTSVESRWKELLFESPWMAESQKRAARLLAAGIAEYLADFAREGKVLVGAESRFTIQVDRADVNGSIDRVERGANGQVVIVDLKTGTPITKQDAIDAHPQLGVYQLAYASGVLDEYLAELGDHSPGGAKLLYVKKGIKSKLYRESVQAALDEEQLEAFRTRIRVAAMGMASAEFQGAIELASRGPSGPSELAIHRVRAVSSD